MRSKTPIQQQRRTQTQLSRSRPHNPSITRRQQPSGQRQSAMRQMQQSSRQRQTRQRQSTPLPEKPRRTRQTTHRSHANRTFRHMVNHTPPPFQTQKGETQKKGGERNRRERKTTRSAQGNTMVFGDNVRARRAARALPRTPINEEEEERRRREGRQATRTTHPSHHHHSTMTHTPPQRRHTKPTML